MRNSPQFVYGDFFIKRRGTPKAKSGIAKAEMSTLNPKSEMIHAVKVVPTFAPKMTAIDCCREMSPALTNETIIVVVAEEDWTSAVMKIPVRAPRNLLLVIRARIFLSLFPAAFCKPSLISFIP